MKHVLKLLSRHVTITKNLFSPQRILLSKFYKFILYKYSQSFINWTWFLWLTSLQTGKCQEHQWINNISLPLWSEDGEEKKAIGASILRTRWLLAYESSESDQKSWRLQPVSYESKRPQGWTRYLLFQLFSGIIPLGLTISLGISGSYTAWFWIVSSRDWELRKHLVNKK